MKLVKYYMVVIARKGPQ